MTGSKKKHHDEEEEPPKIESASSWLEQTLGFGRFQFFQVWVFSTCVCFIGAMNTFQFVYTITKREHRCALPPELEHSKFDHTTFANHSHLVGECSMVEFSNDTECLDWKIEHPNDIEGHSCINVDANVPCKYGYVYENSGSDYFWSMAAEDDWVCNDAGRGSNLFMAQSVGIIFNSLVFMQLSDSWGRQPVFHITNATYIISRLLLLFFHESYWLSMVIVALGSAYYPVGIRVAYTVVAEYTNEKGRLHLYVAGWVTWVMGICFLSLVAWATKHWFAYSLATTIPNFLLFIFWWLSPESPRLLLTKGKVAEAEKIIRTIKRINREEVPEDFTKQLQEISLEISGEKRAGVFTLFSSRRMAMITFLFAITWTVNDFFYIGGQMNVENLAGNQFVNFALAALTELPSVFIGELLCNSIGRRWSHVLCVMVATIFFGVNIFLSPDPAYGTTVTILAMCAKTASNVGWFVNYLQNMEIFPTTARMSGMNLTATVSVALGISAPYVVLLGSTNIQLMYGIFTMVGVLGMVAASFLPESYKEEFPECISDIDRRPKYPYFSWRVWKYKKVENAVYQIGKSFQQMQGQNNVTT